MRIWHPPSRGGNIWRVSEPARKPEGPLRRGWTTGACATAAARAAFEALLTGRFPDAVSIRLPRGQTPRFPIESTGLAAGAATAGVRKDAGDDPDVTHGALVLATVSRAPAGAGIRFRAGEGVGTVTRPGLPLPVGEPAINPKPREMIRGALTDLAEEMEAAADLDVTIAIPGGEDMAARTMNGRLGIVGGLSVLGTTGIVIPYSCASWIHSIHRGVDVARAAGLDHLAAATGSTSESVVRELYGLAEIALLDMGDFAGATLKYLRRHPVARLTVAGGFGKLTKLAQGCVDLHSARSRVDFGRLAGLLGELGAPPAAVAEAETAATSVAVLDAARSLGLPLGDAIAGRARETALATLAGATAVDIVVIDRAGDIVGRAGP